MLTEMQEPGVMKQMNGTGREVGYYSTKHKKNIQNETRNRPQERGQAQEKGAHEGHKKRPPPRRLCQHLAPHR